MKTIALFPAHPSQFWIMYELAKKLNKNYKILWFCRDKDVLVNIAHLKGVNPVVLSKAKTRILGNSIEFLINIFKCLYYTHKYNIDLWISKYGSAHISAFLLNKNSIAFTDDDVDIIPLTAWTSYPFTRKIIAPVFIRQGAFSDKFKTMNAFFEMCYLYPNRFIPDKHIYQFLNIEPDKKFAVIRLTSLMAHHDININGINNQLLEQIITILNKHHIQPLISSEKELLDKFKKYSNIIPADKIHQVLYFSELFIGDSQTMTSESAILGTVTFRFSDFTGQLSNINELEYYGLIHSFKTSEQKKFIYSLEHFLRESDASKYSKNSKYQIDDYKLLQEKEDPLTFFIKEIKMTLENKKL